SPEHPASASTATGTGLTTLLEPPRRLYAGRRLNDDPVETAVPVAFPTGGGQFRPATDGVMEALVRPETNDIPRQASAFPAKAAERSRMLIRNVEACQRQLLRRLTFGYDDAEVPDRAARSLPRRSHGFSSLRVSLPKGGPLRAGLSPTSVGKPGT